MNKTIAIVSVVLFFLLLSVLGYWGYENYYRKFLPFFINANTHVLTFGSDPYFWTSNYFQPVTERIEENSDGVILHVRYRNSNNEWKKAKVLLYSNKEEYKIENIRVGDSVTNLPAVVKSAPIKSKEDAKKMIKMNEQILILLWSSYPNASDRTEEHCAAVNKVFWDNLCKISDIIDNHSPDQLRFWDTEKIDKGYLIPNFIVTTPINED